MATIQLRRDSAADWTSVNPTLSQGEIGVETDTGRFKIGDGSTAWTSLDYFAADGDVNLSDAEPADLAAVADAGESTSAARGDHVHAYDGLATDVELAGGLAGKSNTDHGHSAGDVSSGTLPVPRGGSGVSSVTSGSYLRGQGTSALQERTAAQTRSDIGADNASNLASGTVPTARLGSGTADDSVFLRGDGAWAEASVDTATLVGFVNHGANAATARPTGYGMLIWNGTVEPDNIDESVDFWNDVS